MKSISLFVAFLVITMSAAFALEIKGTFDLATQVTQLKEGDLVEGVFKLWPIENSDLEEFKNIQNKLFFNTLQVVEVQSVAPSLNNVDVIEIKALFAVKIAKDNSLSEIKYKNQSIAIETPAFKVIPLEVKNKDYFILDQSLAYSNWFTYFLIVGLSMVGVVVFYKRSKIIKLFKGIRTDPTALAIKNFTEKFSNAKNREDFEEIYLLRKEWLKLIKEQAPAYQDFFKILNQYQYKKDWNSEELKEVRDSFDVIRWSFK